MKSLNFGNITSLKEAKLYGIVTKGNSKILGSTFSTDPFLCKSGAFLAKLENSVCKACYARKLAKVYPSALKSWNDNLMLFRKALENDDLTSWSHAIAYQIENHRRLKIKKGLKGADYHRWFASGDLDNVAMMQCFVYIAKLLPHIKFWLPTREFKIIRQYLNSTLEPMPENLTIRLSDTAIDQTEHFQSNFNNAKIVFSSVHTNEVKQGIECPAYKNSGNCGNCSMCWNSNIETISYKKH